VSYYHKLFLVSKVILLCAISLCCSLSIVFAVNRDTALRNFTAQKPIIHTLKNGLTLVIDVDKRSPVVAHTIWYKVGSADEREGESGIAHFLEHLMFRGTKTQKAGYFSKRISEIGGEDNAFTTNDLTAYYQNIPVKHIAEIMALEADRMRNLEVTEKELIRERDVVLEERSLRTDTNPIAQLMEQMGAILYRNHPYGSPVIGWQHEIAALNKKQVMAFYKKYYAPNNAIVTVVGDVNPQEMIELAEKNYGKILPAKYIRERMRPSEPPQLCLRSVNLVHKNVNVDSLLLMLESVSPVKQSKAFYALSAALNAIAGGSHSILYKELVKKQKIAVSVGAYVSADRLDKTPVIFQIVPAKNVSLADLKIAFMTEIEKIIKNGVPLADINREKNKMITDYISLFDSRGNRARLWGIGLTLGQNIDDIVTMPQTIGNVTKINADAQLKNIFLPSNQVWGFLQGEEQ
jgi:zinc protease